MKSKKTLTLISLSLLPLVLIIVFFLRSNEGKPIRLLPIYGPKQYITKEKDTVFHKIKNFGFLNQDNLLITQETIKDKLVIADYFFTTCQSICPKMTSQMRRVALRFKDDKGIVFLSHTVNPEEDSVSLLKRYAINKGASGLNWHFLTGEKKALYKHARESYLLDDPKDVDTEEDFIHTEQFVLVDRERCIRGYYDGTDSVSVNELINDIKLLQEEYDWKTK